MVVPPQGRSKVFTELNEAHPGESHMKALARSYVWLPGMDQEIVKKVKSCDKCQSNQSAPAEAPLHPWEWPGLPWSRIHIDYAGLYKGEMFLVVVDAYSKWLEVHHLRSITSTATIEKLCKMFATHCLPATLVSDNGSNFTSAEFQEFMKRMESSTSRCHLITRLKWLGREGYENTRISDSKWVKPILSKFRITGDSQVKWLSVPANMTRAPIILILTNHRLD